VKLTGHAAQRFLARPDKETRAILIYGPNRSRVSEAVSALVALKLGATADDLALTRINEDELRRDPARLMDEIAAQSLLGGERVLRVRAEGDQAAETIGACLADLDAGAPAAAFLIVEGGDLGGKAKIVAAFEKAKSAVAIAFYEEDAAEIASYALGHLQAASVSLDPEAQEAFLALLPDDRGPARAEAEKLALYAHGLGRPVTAEEVRALGPIETEGAFDAAALAALSGKAHDAQEALAGADIANGVSAIKSLERRLLRLAEARCLVNEGASPTEVGQRLRPPVFFKERDAFAAQLRAWTPPKLQLALGACWRAELAAKSAGAPQALIAEKLLQDIARLAAR
jgi:DNA polymerase-3 subunit delta